MFWEPLDNAFTAFPIAKALLFITLFFNPNSSNSISLKNILNLQAPNKLETITHLVGCISCIIIVAITLYIVPLQCIMTGVQHWNICQLMLSTQDLIHFTLFMYFMSLKSRALSENQLTNFYALSLRKG